MRPAKRQTNVQNEVPCHPCQLYKTFKPEDLESEGEWQTDSSSSDRPNTKHVRIEGPESPYIGIARSDEDLVAALNLIAESVEQQRDVAVASVMKTPIYMVIMALLLTVIFTSIYNIAHLPVVLLFWGGSIIASLLFMKRILNEYDTSASYCRAWVWLYGDEPLYMMSKTAAQKKLNDYSRNLTHRRLAHWIRCRNVVIVSYLNREIIATVVLRVKFEKDYMSVITIRAWTVKKKYRYRGVGSEILTYAVQLCYNMNWNPPCFSDYHANAQRVLPRALNGYMNHLEDRAYDKLYRECKACWEFDHRNAD